MKKQDYWKIIRTERAHGSNPRVRSEGVIEVDDEGLASYSHDYWKQNGVMPEDCMPIPEKETAYNSLRALWRVAMNDSSFIPAVLDVYEQNYFTRPVGPSGDRWFHIRHYEETGPFRSTVEAPQIRRILQKALRESGGISIKEEKKTITGLMHWCLEYCELKHLASSGDNSPEWAKALFNNADILSLISETSFPTKEIETVLETFEETKRELNTRSRSPADADKTSFDTDIRPILVGKLMKEARTFGAWQKVFIFCQDKETKIFALYAMSERAKSVNQTVELYLSATTIGMAALAHSFMESWRDMCSNMAPEELVKLPATLQLNPTFIQALILQKCEE